MNGDALLTLQVKMAELLGTDVMSIQNMFKNLTIDDLLTLQYLTTGRITAKLADERRKR